MDVYGTPATSPNPFCSNGLLDVFCIRIYVYNYMFFLHLLPGVRCLIFVVHPSSAFLRSGKQHPAAHFLSEDNPLPGKMSFSPSEPAAQSTGAIYGLVGSCGDNRSPFENGNRTEIHCRGGDCPPQSSSDKVSQDPDGL